MTIDKVEESQSAIEITTKGLYAFVRDWANWDDTYNFAQTGNHDYIDSNLADSTFIDNRFNMMAVVDKQGSVVFVRTFDLNKEQQVPVPETLFNYLGQTSPLIAHSEDDNGSMGLISLPHSPMMVASQPILTSYKNGPFQGTLLVGRYLDAAEMTSLSNDFHLCFEGFVLNDPQMTDDFKNALPHLLAGTPIYVQPLDEKMIAGYMLLKDVNNQPALVLRCDDFRPLYEQSKTDVIYFIISLLSLGVLFFILIWFILEKWVISRIANLSKAVSAVGISDDHSRQISLPGKDEVSKLAADINNMLQKLENSRKLHKESESFNYALLQDSPNPIEVINPDGSIKYVNPALEKISGYTAGELVGQLPPYPFWPEDSTQEHSDSYPSDIRAGRKMEGLFQKKNGESFWVDITSTPIMEGFSIKYTLSIWVDITAQKRASEELEKLYQLEKGLREALQAEIKGRTEFTRALVHELKTPLTPIMVSSELLVEELTQEPLLGLARNVHKGAQNMNKRVDELLDMARGEVGILKINLRPVDLEVLLKEIVKYVKPLARNSGQTLVLNIDHKLPIITAADDRIRQVLLNLINNSIKYSTGNGTITISAKEDGNNLIIEIQDTGRGMSEEEQKRLFQPYYRIEGKQHLSGLGLGLSLSKRLVELHNGKIWLKSKKGVGSTFSFSLPIKIDT